MSFRALLLGLFAAVAMGPAPAAAEPRGLPVPTQVIYPGDRIADAALTNSQEAANAPPPGAIWDRADLVGKVARRTLLPGRPIPAIAVEEPRVLSVGGPASLVYEQDGISIVTTGQALQNAYVGQLVQVRNLDSGLVVTGVVQADGAVRVSGG
jgi:flagella basal body P-ring formation protein FlgA